MDPALPGPVLCPGREVECGRSCSQSRPLSSSCGEKHRGSRRLCPCTVARSCPRPCPGPSRMVTLLGPPRPSRGGPTRGLAWSQSPPAGGAIESTEHLDLHILLCLYSMYRIYSIGQLFPSRLEVSPKMTSFINKYIYKLTVIKESYQQILWLFK